MAGDFILGGAPLGEVSLGELIADEVGGDPTVTRSVSATGSVALTQLLTLSTSIPISGTGSTAFARQVSHLRAFALASSGAVSQTKQVGLPRGITASGSTSAQQVVGVKQESPTFTATGSVAASNDTVIGQVRVYAASASSALSKHIGKFFSYVGTGKQVLTGDGIEPSTGRGIIRLMIRTIVRPTKRSK